MKKIPYITLKTNEGTPMFDAVSKKELDTKYLLTVCLGNSKYPNVADQWMAYEINKKLEDGKDVELEETEYTLVKKLVEAYEPYRNGFTFIPFLELFK